MQVRCPNPSCRHMFEIPEGAAGSRLQCPRCNMAAAFVRTDGPPVVQASPAATADVPLYLRVPSITDPELRSIPALESFQVLNPGEQLVKSYQIRVRRPKFRWDALLLALVLCAPAGIALCAVLLNSLTDKMHIHRARDEQLMLGGLVGSVFVVLVGGIALFLLMRVRGHTFLYLTNQRVTILELEEGLFRKHQAVCNFSLDDISGFQLLAQRGLLKLLGLLLLKEKRTFYLAITTRTCANVEVGAVRWRRGGKYDPGRDAVALCSELDSKVLALRTAARA